MPVPVHQAVLSRPHSRGVTAVLLLVYAAFSPVRAASPNPDLTAPGAIAALKVDAQMSRGYDVTYNLGPTGLRGWIYVDPANKGAEGLMTDQSRQILVTHVGAGTPALGVLAIDDVILGAGWGSGGAPVPDFDGDCRKAFGRAIGEAEKTENGGILRLKRSSGNVTTDVQITLPVKGTYAETAPFGNCPKSAAILADAIPILEAETLTGDWKGAVSALALLSTGDPDHVPAVRTLARSLSNGSAALQTGRGLNSWDSGYIAVLLAEYYLATNDAEVLPGIHNYAVALSRSQSLYGTFGHKGSMLRSDGGYNGSIPWYGPVNSAGLPANMGIVLAKMAILASGGTVEPEIAPAIVRASNFFSYYVNKGAIPYGEHETWPAHADNGKGGMAAVMFALMGDKPLQTEYYARLCISSHVGEEYGHTGQGFSFLWTALGANAGGADAAAAFLKEVRWHRDLSRRADGSFVYDGAEQYGGSTVADYWSPSSYSGLSPTATYVLQLTLPLRNLHISGKDASPLNTPLSAGSVANAVWAGRFSQECSGYSTSQLVAAFSEYDTVVRNSAAIELGTRTGEFESLRPQLIVMAEDMADAGKREAACHALGYMGNSAALPTLGRRLSDPDPWVRTRAADALGQLGSLALPELNTMMMAFINNATDPGVIVWDDPLQIANGSLAQILFQTQPFRNEIRNQPAALFHEAVRVGLRQPDGYARGQLANLIKQDLTWNDVQAVAPDLVEAIKERSPADQMFSEGIRYAGLETLAKFKVEEGIPLCLMVKEQNWHSDEWEPFIVLRDLYGTAAAEVLPTLYDWQNHLPAFDADGSISDTRYANIESYIASTIAALEGTSPAAAMSYFKTVDVGAATPLAVNSLQLTASATDLDGGTPRYIWSVVSGPGQVAFAPNGTPASATTIATFETPGSYVLRASVADSSILNTGVWNKPVLGYVDFQTYEHDYGLAHEDRVVLIGPGSNWPPVAYPQTVATGIDAARTLTLVGFDHDGDSLSYAITTPPAHGSLSINLPNVTYTPNAGFRGNDSFSFTVTDGRGISSAPATVSLAVRDALRINVNCYNIAGTPTPSVESTLIGLLGPAGGLGTTWNQYNINSAASLKDSGGATTDVGYSLTGYDGGWIWGNPALNVLDAGRANFGIGDPHTLTLGGLAAGRKFDVWIASANCLSSQRSAGTWSTTHATTSAASQFVSNVGGVNGSTWVSGNNYALFEDVAADEEGEIVFTSEDGTVGATTYRFPLNGFQLVELPPEPPAPPDGQSAAPGDTAVQLSWNPVPGAVGYLVKRSGTPGGPYVVRANPSSTFFLDAPASNGQTWHYVISAVNAHGEGPASQEVSATPVATVPPEAPTGLAATAGDGFVDLVWNVSATATSYTVKRGIHPGGPYATIASSLETGWQDTSVLNGMTWYYVVTASNIAGESFNSTEAAALPRTITQVIHVNLNAWSGSGAVGTEAPYLLEGPAGGLGSTWNQFAAASAPVNLVNSTGATTGITFSTTVSAAWTWGSPAIKMLHSGASHFSKGQNTTLTISGMTPGGIHRVWLTSHANNSTAAERAHGSWSTSSAGSQTINGVTTLNGTNWQAGNNYVLFENVVADANGRIVFVGDATDAGEFDTLAYRLPLNGFQIWEYDPEPPPPFRVWAIDHSVTGTENDDDDNDGLSNFDEYAFGLDPTGGSSVNPITIPFDKTTGTFSYTRRSKSLAGLTYTVCSSTTLAPNGWTDLVKDTDYTEAVSASGEVETVTITLTPAPTAARMFLQVRAE